MNTDALQVLKDTFGYPAFRGAQAGIIGEVLAGRDALVLMPTGGGKSLCYQIPALLRPGVGVVVSPLIALMKDQVDALRQLGVRSAFLNSSLSPQQAQDVEQQLLQGDLDLLYVAPERLMTPRTLSLLERVPLALFAIDEAHCVSQWGHDFRPEYLQLSRLAELFGGVPRLALTATADAATRQVMVEKLSLGSAKQFVSSFDRPNIRYTVVDKDNARAQFLDFYRGAHQGASGIVYCLSRKSVDETAAWLAARGVAALAYHAGLEQATRMTHQERFLREDGLVMVATIAFGMGIDKPDVRFVAHLDLPKSLEGYYQETGRAGRDGLAADAFMTYGLADVVAMRRLLARSEAGAAFKRLEQQKLEALLGYCESPRCRRQVLLAYFGEALEKPCGNCDTCLTPVETWEGTVAAQKALSAVYRSGQRFGAGHVIDVLMGKDTPRMAQLGHQRLSTFGVGADLSEVQWRSVFRQLAAAGYLEADAEGYGSLKLTPRSAPVLKGREAVRLRRDPEARKAKKSAVTKRASALASADAGLFEALRALRAELAKEQGVPAYVIFHDATLREMAGRKPGSLAALRAVSGVGEAKLSRYGAAFLGVLQAQGGTGKETSKDDPKNAQPDTSDRDTYDRDTYDRDTYDPDTSDRDTYDETLRLTLTGHTPEAVARARKLTLQTVENHLAELVRRGSLTPEEATGLEPDELRRIERVWAGLPEGERRYLKPLHEALAGQYGYGVIKCVLAGLEP